MELKELLEGIKTIQIIGDEQVEVAHITQDSRKIIEFPLSSIQEIRSKISGILPTIFQYGEVSIATANSQEIMKLPYI